MRTVRLDQVAEIASGVGFPVGDQGGTTGDLPFVKVSDLRLQHGHVVTTAANYVSTATARRLHARICPPGTVLFPKVGGALLTNQRAVLGVPAVFDNNVMGVVPTKIFSEWLYFWLCSIDLARFANTQTLPSIRQSVVAALQVPLPEERDQRRFASDLTRTTAIARDARAATAERQRAISGLRHRAYELAFEHAAPLSVDRGIRSAPPGWTWHLLTDLARLESGHTPSRSRPEWWRGDIPWIALPDIRGVDGGVARSTIERTNPDGIANSSARILPANTVVMSRTASVGFVTRMGRPMATSQDFVNWVCGPDLDPEFLMYLLIRSRDEIRALSSGAIHKTVYMPTLKSLRVCVPGVNGQRRIAAELRDQIALIDTIESSIRAEREAIQALPGSLLRRAFGELAA